MICFATSAPYCEVKESLPNLYATIGQNFVIPLSEFFNGYNMTYAAEASDATIAQTATTSAFTQFTFQNPLSHDIWKNTDGSSMHAVLDERNNYKTLFFGQQQANQDAIQWSVEQSIQIPLRNCFSATLIKYDIAAIDCFDTQNGQTYNVWYTIALTNLDPKYLVPQNFTDNWRAAVVRVDGRKTVKYWNSELLGIESNWGQRVRQNLNLQQGQKFEILYLFSAAPYDKTYPNDENLGSEILVYGVNFDSGDDRYPNGQLIFERSIDGTDFQMPSLYLLDLASTTSGIFFITTNSIYGFQYGLGNLGNVRSYELRYETLQFAIIQEGYRFSFAVAAPTAVYEYDWNIPNKPVPRGIYQAPQNANTKVVRDLQINFAYIMLSLEYESFFLQRNIHQISNTPYIINYRPSPSYITKLLYNDFVVSISPTVTNIINLTPSYLSVKAVNIGSQQFELVARSEDAISFISCSATLTIIGVQPGDTQVYQTNMKVKTVFDGFPGRQYVFPVDGPFAGSNINYQLQSLGNQKQVADNQKTEKTERKLHQLKNQKFLEATIPEDLENEDEINQYLENLQGNSTVFSLVQSSPAVGSWPPFQNAKTILYSYTWYDNLNGQYFYTFNQAQVGLGYQIFISACQLINFDPHNFNCSSLGSALINGPIKTMAASSFFGSNLFVVSYETSVQAFVSVFNFTGELFHTFPVQPGPENLVTDIDIIGSYCFLSQPILRQVSVFWFNPNEYFPGLYNLTEETIGNWPYVGNGAWSPVGVWGHTQLPNLIYVELLNSIVSIAISFSNPIYVHTYNLSSIYTDSAWSRTISVTPYTLTVAEVFSSGEAFSQNITEFLALNPYDPIKTQNYNFYGWTIRFPIVASASIQSNNLYVIADNYGTNQTAFLSFKSLVPQINSLFYIGILNASSTDTLTISSGSFYNDYVLVVNKADGSVQPFFIPESAYVSIKPPNIDDPLSYTETLPFEVLVSGSNPSQAPISVNAQLLVVNPQTAVTVNTANDNYNFNSNGGYVTTLWVDDSKWTIGSLYSYDLTGGSGTQFTNIINHLSNGQNDLYGLTGVTSLVSLADNQNFLVLTAAAVIYQLNSTFSISAKPVTLPIDIDVYSCQALLPVYQPDGVTLLLTLTFCQQKASGSWFAFPVSYASIDPFPLGQFQLTSLPDLNINNLVWYDNFLYVLNAPQIPVKGRPGNVYVYNFDFSEPGSAELQIVLGPATFNVTSEFSVASFLIMPAGAKQVAQLFMLDAFGHGLLYATYNTGFSGEGPSDFIYSSLVWDIFDQLRGPSINAYLPDTAIYYSLISVGEPSITTNSIVYSVALLTDITPIYQFRLIFTIPPNNNSRPLAQPPLLTRVYGTYNGVYQTVNNLKYSNNTLFCPFYNPIANSIVILSYNMAYVPPGNFSTPIVTPAQSGINVPDSPYKTTPYMIYNTPSSNNGNPQLIIAPNQNALNSINYNPLLGLQFTDCNFKNTELVLNPNTLTNQKVATITVSINNTDPGPGPSPTPSPSPSTSSSSTSSGSSGSQNTGTSSGGNGLTWLWVLLGVVGGIALIGVAVWFVRRKQLAEDHEPLAAPIEGDDSIRN